MTRPWSWVVLNEAREYAHRSQSMRAGDPDAAMFWRRHAAMYLSIAKRWREREREDDP